MKLVLVLPLMLLAGCAAAPPTPSQPSPSALQEAAARIQAAAVEDEIAALHERALRLRLGDDAINLYRHCVDLPPQNPANQKRCHAAVAKVKREEERMAREEASW